MRCIAGSIISAKSYAFWYEAEMQCNFLLKDRSCECAIHFGSAVVTQLSVARRLENKAAALAT
jgi:hypothetical protein